MSLWSLKKRQKINEASNFVNMDSLFDATISASMDEQNGRISETLVSKDSLTFPADELDKSCIEQQRGSESNLLVLSADQGVCDVENNVNLDGAGIREHPKLEGESNKITELVIGFGNSCGPTKDVKRKKMLRQKLYIKHLKKMYFRTKCLNHQCPNCNH